jgi:hypothetical protein
MLLTSSRSRTEAKRRVKEKKPPKAAINLGTDVDAPWGEKIETKLLQEKRITRTLDWGFQSQPDGCAKIQAHPNACCAKHRLGAVGAICGQ